MPHAEIIHILIVVLAIFLVLKIAKVALKLIFFFVSIAIILGVVYYLFMR